MVGRAVTTPRVDSDLSPLVAPRSIAIVGLSADPGKHGGRVLANLRRVGFSGPIWGVNPKRPSLEGVDVVGGLGSLSEPPDLVVCAVPAPAVPGVVRDAGAAGAGAVIVFAGGFAETGEAGRSAQGALVDAARSSDVRVLGPNSGGVIRPARGLAVSFLTCLDRPAEQIRSGPVGLVTQSGGTGSYMHNLAAARGGGLAVSVSTGNEADLDVADGILALCELDEVRSIALVLETIRRGDAFMRAVEHARRVGKPVVACRIGVSERGRAMVASHTGAIASAERVLDGVLDTLEIPRTETPGELLDVAEILARTPTPPGDRFAVVTHSGGVAILLSDLAGRAGVRLPAPSVELSDRLRPLLDLGTVANPLDMGGIIGGAHRFAEVVDVFASSSDYDGVLAVSTAHPPAHTPARVDALLALQTEVPIVHLWMAGDQGAESLVRLRAAGSPVTEEPRAAVRALAAIGGMARGAPMLDRPPARTGSVGRAVEARSEHAAKQQLAAWGLPVVEGALATTRSEAAALAGRLPGPLVVKISSPDITHKTEVGGVKTGVRGAAAVAAAFDDVRSSAARHRPDARIEGVRIERQADGVEVLVGLFRDPVFGAMLLLGLGGTASEALGGHVVAPAPVPPEAAARVIERVPGLRHVLARHSGARHSRARPGGERPSPQRPSREGPRGHGPPEHGSPEHGDGTAAITSLADLLATASSRFVEAGLAELEMNPVVWTGERWQVLDAAMSVVRSG